jgi:phosphoserine aminotransferase
MLPTAVLERVQAQLLNWQNEGLSAMEMSHRGKLFSRIAEQAQADLRELLDVPAHYHVLFLQGGASAQFAAVPLNLLRGGKRADYIDTGHWSARAIVEASRYCEAHIAASCAPRYCSIPPRQTWQLDPHAAYVHYTPNETIHGVEFHWTPDVGSVPLIADMSSNLLSRPIPVECFGLIYAGAQKNLGPAGLTVVIVRDDLLGGAAPATPGVLNYQAQAAQDSMLNTPPTFAIHVAGLVFQWLKEQGGLKAMEERNIAKAALLYDYLDNSSFYRCRVDKAARSRMNVPFFLAEARLEEAFLSQAQARGLLQLKGHRAIGGMRASLYNAMPVEGVAALVGFLDEFARRHG